MMMSSPTRVVHVCLKFGSGTDFSTLVEVSFVEDTGVVHGEFGAMPEEVGEAFKDVLVQRGY